MKIGLWTERLHGHRKCRYCRRWVAEAKALEHWRVCPGLCPNCAEPLEEDGVCPRLCLVR